MSLRKLGIGLASALLLSLPTGPVEAASLTPVYLSDGSVSRDFSLSRIINTDKLLLGNYSAETARFDYVDPVYGAQSVVLAPGGEAAMCAVAYDGTYRPVNLSFDSAKTGYGYFVSVGAGGFDVESARERVTHAKATLVKARSRVERLKMMLNKAQQSGRTAGIRSAKSRLAVAKRRLAVAKRDYAQAKSELTFLESEAAFCRDRRAS